MEIYPIGLQVLGWCNPIGLYRVNYLVATEVPDSVWHLSNQASFVLLKSQAFVKWIAEESQNQLPRFLA